MRGLRRVSSERDVDLDTYAEICAHLRHFPSNEHDEVVARLGVRPRLWRAVTARWSRELEASVDAGKADLAQRYAATFARTKRRLASVRPSLESLGDLPEAEPETPPPPEPASIGPAPSLEANVAVPSYLSSPVQEGPAVPGFMKIAPPPVSAAAPEPARPARPRTMGISIAASTPEEMPFKATDTSAEAAIQRAVAHASAVQPKAPDKPSASGGTADITELARGSLPFARSAKPIPQYTIERYASLRVELEEYAERNTDVLERYKLDRDTARALDEDWNRRMNADAALRARFQDAFDRYKAWLRSNAANKR